MTIKIDQTVFGADADMWPCAKGKHDRCRGQIIDRPTSAVWTACPCECHHKNAAEAVTTTEHLVNSWLGLTGTKRTAEEKE